MKENKEETKLQSDLERVRDWAKCGIYHNHGHNESKANDYIKILDSVISQFKSQLPIEQKPEMFALKQKFLKDMLAGKSAHDLFEEYVRSEPSPIVEREQFSIEDMIGFAEFLDPSDCTPEWYKRRISDWLATRKS